VSWISDFEQTAAELAIENQYKNVICGHIHQPQIKTVTTSIGSVTYMNSGDWVENLTSLEYDEDGWRMNHWNGAEISLHEVNKIKVENKIPLLNVTTEDVLLNFNSFLNVAAR
jgi:predicted phosphodiesterase